MIFFLTQGMSPNTTDPEPLYVKQRKIRGAPTEYQQHFLDMRFDQFISQTNINDILNEEYLMQYPKSDAIDMESLQTCQKYAFEKLGRVKKWDGCFLKYLKFACVEPLGAETSPIVDLREKSPAPQQEDEGAAIINMGEETKGIVNLGVEAKGGGDSMEQGDGEGGAGVVGAEFEVTDNIGEEDGGSQNTKENMEKTIDANITTTELQERLSQLTSGIIVIVKDLAEKVDRFVSCENWIEVDVSRNRDLHIKLKRKTSILYYNEQCYT